MGSVTNDSRCHVQAELRRALAKMRRFDGEPASEERLLALLRCTGGHVRALALQQLPVHLDLAAVFQHLPGSSPVICTSVEVS